MGAHLSLIYGGQDAPADVSTQPLQCLGRLSKKTYRCNSRGQNVYKTSRASVSHTSASEDPWRQSFLNLPEEVRKQVYAGLLSLDVQVRITPTHVTKVPGLVLFQTCKQLHNEVAALFYSSNTFSCVLTKIVPAQKTSIEDPQYPSIESAIDSRTLHDPLNISDGIFFPAPRYQTYLTHIVIRLDMTIAHFDLSSCSTMPAFTTPGLETGLTRVEMEAMHHALQHKVRCVLQRMKRLWRGRAGRAGRWSGKLVIPSRTSWTKTQMYEIEFTMV
ncbi:hypothetical protein HBI70_182480 [Parastagonospora nodorum]|nr:hypothetical protein HBH52_208320 [Parastagonospora nodorum]KAH4104847.1 hypothetical protein HBH46_093770 [Parastagonospora nodorum]KAH4114537.1 hypothetical protein HBH47_195410 [Parastagonospora nodorum]KAH4216037.1 hypothetical protein HBI06_236160 [Parastagonospora nodorum]KAH4232494.1 hypothetical protein HBI05_173400 [Parastagonospora nodorum]